MSLQYWWYNVKSSLLNWRGVILRDPFKDAKSAGNTQLVILEGFYFNCHHVLFWRWNLRHGHETFYIHIMANLSNGRHNRYMLLLIPWFPPNIAPSNLDEIHDIQNLLTRQLQHTECKLIVQADFVLLRNFHRCHQGSLASHLGPIYLECIGPRRKGYNQ